MMIQKQKLEFALQTKMSEVSSLNTRDKMKEDRKDERVDKQSENQSKLIEQRKNNQGAQEFENNTQSIINQMIE